MTASEFIRLHFDVDEVDAEFDKTLMSFLTPGGTK